MAASGARLAVVTRITELLAGQRVAVLTGAGLSTDSGIPDYRSPDARPRTPITYQQFVRNERMRRHYWARNHVGWHHMRRADPNAGHYALAELERSGVLTGLVTQNVDRLHQGAGSSDVLDLHGRFDQVVCLQCPLVMPRADLEPLLDRLNPGYLEAHTLGDIAPDADADIADTEDFVVADCPGCGSMLKPDFVFFGENVPRERVAHAYAVVDAADCLLVAGTSLTVMSGFRFVLHAAKAGKPVVIINRGPTRGDRYAALKAEVGVSEAPSGLAAALSGVAATLGAERHRLVEAARWQRGTKLM